MTNSYLINCNRKLREYATYINVFCLAFATLGYELVQTRILSALYYNHVVYITITIALMGFGIAGVKVSTLSLRAEDLKSHIVRYTGLFALAMVFCMAFATRIPVWLSGYSITVRILLSYLILVIPFLCSGTALGLIFMQNGKNLSRLYGFDLVASALACALFTLLLTPLGAEGFVWMCFAVVCITYVMQAERKMLYTLAGSVILLVAVTGGHIVQNRPEAYKTLGRHLKRPGVNWEKSVWTPISRIDIVSSPGAWDKTITQDGDAETHIFPKGYINTRLDMGKKGFMAGSNTLVYLMQDEVKNALVIGVGGGVDIINAKAYGAKNITGVELNPATYGLLQHNYSDFAVWPSWDNVNIVRGEGRNYIHTRVNEFDAITMSGIDTFAALSSGAYVLTENYLYTVEAFEDYLNALKPDGIMVIHRWLLKQPRETVRLASVFIEAAKRLGMEHPEQSILVVSDGFFNAQHTFGWASTFIKKTPFTKEEINRVLRAKTRGIIYLPKIYPQEEQELLERKVSSVYNDELSIARAVYSNVIDAKDDQQRQAFYDSYQHNVTPVYDDNPFFFAYAKTSFGEMFGSNNKKMFSKSGEFAQLFLHIMLLLCILIAVLSMIVPLSLFHRKGLNTVGVSSLLTFFSCLGTGFMFIEIGVMQRLSLYLGDPMYSLLVVLANLLLFAGLGSHISHFGSRSQHQWAIVGTLGTIISVIIWIVVMPFVMESSQNVSFYLRSLLVALSLLPIGLFMGIPFANGLKIADRIAPNLVPWAWGINGVTSVFASIVSIILAMSIGFSNLLYLGVIVYLIALLSIWKNSKIS